LYYSLSTAKFFSNSSVTRLLSTSRVWNLLFIPHNLPHITNHEPKVNGGRDSPKP
jgi:hypothetical protein